MSVLANLFGGGKKESAPPPPPAPSVGDADAKAKEELRRKRRIQERTGGKTILDSSVGSTATKKNLLGE